MFAPTTVVSTRNRRPRMSPWARPRLTNQVSTSLSTTFVHEVSQPDQRFGGVRLGAKIDMPCSNAEEIVP